MSDETISQPRIKLSWLIGVLAAFAIFMLIGAYSRRMTEDFSDYDQDRAVQRYATLAKVRQDENKLIEPVDDQGKPTAEWVDQGKGLVRIPIEEAMDREVDTLKAQPTAISKPIPGAAPAPVPAPSAPPAAPAPPVKSAKKPTAAGPVVATPKPNK